MAYRKVYFRIKSAYSYNCSFPSDDAREQFKNESRQVFQTGGWALHPSSRSGACDTVTKGEQELYLHPMQFSGVIDEAEIPAIEVLLAQATVFHCYHVDLYESYLDMDNNAYRTHLESRREEMIASILARYKTKRCNLFITGLLPLEIAKKFSVHRLCDKNGSCDIANIFVFELVEQLIQEGRLITRETKNGKGIRTATAADAKRS